MRCYYNLKLLVCREELHRVWSMFVVLYGFLGVNKIVFGSCLFAYSKYCCLSIITIFEPLSAGLIVMFGFLGKLL